MAPVDPIYLNEIAGYDREHTDTLAGLGQQRTQAASEYGYVPTYDERGFVKALAIDPNNPYARAAVLKQSYDNHLRSNKQSFASRGQLYAGSLGVAQSLEDQDYAGKSSRLTNDFINFIARNQQGINSANTRWTNAYGNAESNRLARAIAADTGEGDTGGGGGDGGGAAAAPGPVGYSGPKGLQGNVYIDQNGGQHAVQKKGGKTYYLGSSGKWVPIG